MKNSVEIHDTEELIYDFGTEDCHIRTNFVGGEVDPGGATVRTARYSLRFMNLMMMMNKEQFGLVCR